MRKSRYFLGKNGCTLNFSRLALACPRHSPGNRKRCIFKNGRTENRPWSLYETGLKPNTPGGDNNGFEQQGIDRKKR